MQIGRIEGCTRVLGKSQGYLGLPVRDETVVDAANGERTSAMSSAWLPTPAEISAIAAGAPIHVQIFGTGHPPIMLTVGATPA